MNFRFTTLASVACIVAIVAGCGSTKAATHVPHKKSKTKTTSVVTPPPAPPPSPPPLPQINPSVPQPGGLAAATKWLKGSSNGSSIQTIAVKGGYVLLPTQQPAFADLYVNAVNGTWVMLPLNLTVASFERQTSDGGLMFLVQGPEGDGTYSPFPDQVLCELQPDGTFTSQQGPAYFPVTASGVYFGSKSGEVLTGVALTTDGIKFVFGSGSVADYISVPPTRISYDGPDKALLLDFSAATLGSVAGLPSMHSQYIQGVRAENTAQGLAVTIYLAQDAAYYTGSINTPATQTAFAEIDFASAPPAPPWGH